MKTQIYAIEQAVIELEAIKERLKAAGEFPLRAVHRINLAFNLLDEAKDYLVEAKAMTTDP